MERYLTKLMEAFRPFGDVLEVGFGPASKIIQKYQPRSHTILTLDSEATEWATKHGSVKIVPDVWQGVLPSLGVFDAIFFGIDPHGNALFQDMPRVRYSDLELDGFCKAAESADKTYVSRFLAELEQNGQITEEQREKMIERYKLKRLKAPEAMRSKEMLQFFKRCFLSHMRKGSRFSCLLKDDISPAEDLEFFNEVVLNPALDYKEEGRVVVIEKLI